TCSCNNTVCRSKPETSALAFWFCREKWIKDLITDIFRNPASRICHIDTEILSGHQRMSPDFHVQGEFLHRAKNCDRTGSTYRVPGIDQQVQQCLMETCRINVHSGQFLLIEKVDLDPFGKCFPCNVLQIAQHIHWLDVVY